MADGDEIDDARRAAVEDALARVRARLFVVRSLAAKMQSSAEIEKKLAARDVPPDVAREAIERVAGYGYLDDESLAGQLARGMQGRGYGRRRAEQKLRARGLPGDLAGAALDEAYGDHDEVELARTALGRRPVADDAERRRARRIPRPTRLLGRSGLEGGARSRRAGLTPTRLREVIYIDADAARRATPSATVCSRARIPGTPERSRRSSAMASPSSSTSPIPSDPLDDYGHLLHGSRRSPIRSPTWERRRRAT